MEGGTDRKFYVLWCRVIDACTTSNDVSVKSKFVLNEMLKLKVDLYTVAIPRNEIAIDVGMISRQSRLIFKNNYC